MSEPTEAMDEAAPSDTDREVLRWALRNVLTGASVQGDSERGADAVIAAGFSRSQPVQVEVTDDMIARAEREYQWSGNIRKALVAALAVREADTEWEYGWFADEAKRALLTPRGPRLMRDDYPYLPEEVAQFPRGQRVRRRKAGPWVPVSEGSET